MLSVSTLWLVFTVNFLAWSLTWAFVVHRYPELVAARYWSAGLLIAAAAPELVLLHHVVSSSALLLAAALMSILACWLVEKGVRRFYGRPPLWRNAMAAMALSFAGLTYFMFVHDDMTARILIYSLGQTVPIALTLKPLLSRRDNRRNRGASVAGAVAGFMILAFAVRSVLALLNLGGDATVLYFNAAQTGILLLLVFLSMLWNLGFLLMTIERLRAQFTELALVDDLTGAANRRHLLQCLAEQCALAQRSGEPLALLAIDLDGFKGINDGFGHAAGDDCLRQFTRMAQGRLRPRDLLARAGGDEFCIMLPGATAGEAEAIARRVLDGCRIDAKGSAAGIPVTASIGVAQWWPQAGASPERLIAAADQALYAAKRHGKNCYALYNGAPPLAPGLEPESLIWRSS